MADLWGGEKPGLAPSSWPSGVLSPLLPLQTPPSWHQPWRGGGGREGGEGEGGRERRDAGVIRYF